MVFKKYKYQAWYGSFYDAYFDRLENGEWIDVGIIKYYQLKFHGYITRKSLNKKDNEI